MNPKPKQHFASFLRMEKRKLWFIKHLRFYNLTARQEDFDNGPFAPVLSGHVSETVRRAGCNRYSMSHQVDTMPRDCAEMRAGNSDK